jgi:hypothetical protein
MYPQGREEYLIRSLQRVSEGGNETGDDKGRRPRSGTSPALRDKRAWGNP